MDLMQELNQFMININESVFKKLDFTLFTILIGS